MLALNEIAKKYKVSKKTLRYYDDIDLLKAIRKDNNYRYYDVELEARLKYIFVMKKAGFSLEEMKTIFSLDEKNDKGDKAVIGMLEEKRSGILEEVEALKGIVQLIDLFQVDCEKKNPAGNMVLVHKILGLGDEKS